MKRFQEAVGLTASGEVDAVTAAKLKNPWDELAPAIGPRCHPPAGA